MEVNNHKGIHSYCLLIEKAEKEKKEEGLGFIVPGVVEAEENPHIGGIMQFKSMLFKSQLYFRYIDWLLNLIFIIDWNGSFTKACYSSFWFHVQLSTWNLG